jgi:tetratricopeptide (TPR) repeat protein
LPRLPLGTLAAAGRALHATGDPKLALSVFDVALDASPGDPDLLTSLASAARASGETARAEKAIREAIALEPTAKRYTVLACVYRDRSEAAEAERYFREALRIDPMFADAQGLIAQQLLERWHAPDESDDLLHEARELIQQAIDAQPDHTDHRHVHLAILQALGLSQDAADTATALVNEVPWQPDFHIHRAWANLRLGKNGIGFAEYANWLYKRERFKNNPVFKFAQWTGGPGEGRHVYVWNPEGAGDYFMLARYLKNVADAGWIVHVVANETISRLFALVPGVSFVHDPDEDIEPEFQTATLHLAAAHAFEPIPTAPYLLPDAETVERWRPALEAIPRPRVGVLWRGNGKQGNDARRSFEPEALRPILAVPGVSFVSLQKGHRFKAGSLPIHDLGVDYQGGDWLDTAGVLAHLDLVITPCTGMAHIAAAAHVPTWVALSDPGCYRWQIDREDSPWYPSLRLFRQAQRGSWDGVFERMAQALGTF